MLNPGWYEAKCIFLHQLHWDTRFSGRQTTFKRLYSAFKAIYPGDDQDQLHFNIIFYISALTI